MRLRIVLSILLVGSVLGGCATQPKQAEAENPAERVAVEAPLGSRIKKRTNITPVSGANRQDIDNARVMQGQHQAGVVNRGGN